MTERIPQANPYTAEGADARNTDIIITDGADRVAEQPESEANPVKRGLLKRLAGSARWLDRANSERGSVSVPARRDESAVDMINRLNPGQLLPLERPAPRSESAADMVGRVNSGMIIPKRPPQGRLER